MESAAVDAGTTLLVPTRLTSQLSTSPTVHQPPPPTVLGAVSDATVSPNLLPPRRPTSERMSTATHNVANLGGGGGGLGRRPVAPILDVGTSHAEDDDSTPDDDSNDGTYSDDATTALDAGGVVAKALGGALGVHRRQSDRRAGADTPNSTGGGAAAPVYATEELTMAARLEEREQLRTEAATRAAEAQEEATRVAIASNEPASSQRVRTNPTAESDFHVFMRVLAADGQMGEPRLAKAKFATQKYFPKLKKELRKPVKVFESYQILLKITNFHLKCLTRVELGGVGGLSPDHCALLSAVEPEESPWINISSSLPTPLTISSFTSNVLLWEAQGKALGSLLKLVYCASLGDKYVTMIGHLAHLVRHCSEDWSMPDAREALSALGEEFTQRLSGSVENIKLEIQAAKNIGGSGAAPTVAQLLGVATSTSPDGSSFFTSAHVVYDLGPASYFETEVVDDFVQRRKRRTKRLARGADNALRESMRGRLRGSGNAGSNPGADEDDDDPPRVNDDPPRGGIISGASHFCFGSMETADVEALVQLYD